MKLLVLAHIPPPLHGQSVMVQVMLDGLSREAGFDVRHVNFRLSRDNANIGRWHPAKVVRSVWFALNAIAVRFRHGCDTLYYIPAPAKRGALYRDWIVMALCRPFFPRLVLHWHAAGLGSWLTTQASGIERSVTRMLLGKANLSIVLATSLRGDAEYLRARHIAVVPNGVADPGQPPARDYSREPFQGLFLGLCSEEKGLFAAAAAVMAANRRRGTATSKPRFTLVAAGPFEDSKTADRFLRLAESHPSEFRYVGFADDAVKKSLFATSHCLIFPTRYAAEGLPLVMLEALAHDLPILATRWRALPDIVTPDCGSLVEPGNIDALTDALVALQSCPPKSGAGRERFVHYFTRSRHVSLLTAALAELESSVEKHPRRSAGRKLF